MDTPLTLHFHGMPTSPAIQTAAEKWLAKLERVYHRLQRCEVAIEEPHRHQRKGREFHARVRLVVPHAEIVTEQSHEDAGVALRDAFQAARRRLEEHAEPLRGPGL